MKTFVVVWFGQIVSMIGSGITAFGVSVWVYQETSSVTLFALNAFLNFLPRILLSPLAGVLADRWGRRRMMIMADSGAAVSTVFLALVFLSGNLAVWHVYLLTAANALFSTFQSPAYSAAITALAPEKHYTRVSAMNQLGGQVSGLVAPTMAGFLFLWIGLPGIMLIDFTTFLLAVSILLVVRFPELTGGSTGDSEKSSHRSMFREMLEGWRYVAEQPALRGLLMFSGINLFFIAVNATLSIPILVSITPAEIVGIMALIFGIGGVLGSIIVAVWGGTKRRIYSVFGAHLLVGVGLILFGLRPNLILMTIAGFGISSILPLRDGATEAIWRSKVPPELQGRVFALLQMVGSAAFGLAYLIVGPLGDGIFEPLMDLNGPLADSVGRVIGAGDGRGMALCVVLAGALTLAMTVMAILNSRIRQMENQLPEPSIQI